MKSIRLLILIILFASVSFISNAETHLIRSTDPSDIIISKKGKDIPPNPTIVKGYDENEDPCMLNQDIDHDGNIEVIDIYDEYSGLQIGMYKHPPFKDDEEYFSVGDWYELNYEIEDLSTEDRSITLALHDFDNDGVPEIVLSYIDGLGIKGVVYKLNGVSQKVNLKELQRLRNWFEPVGSFEAYNDAYIDKDSIVTQTSPRGGNYSTYIYLNGRLNQLIETIVP